MSKSREIVIARIKLAALLLTLVISNSTVAAIFEGRFYGKMWDWYHTNMDETPEALFWASENSYTDFIGTAWYDVDLAKRTARKTQQEPPAGLRNWPHPTATTNNTPTISNNIGSFPAVTLARSSSQKLEFEEYESRFESYGNVAMNYSGSKNPVIYHNAASAPYDSFFEGMDLIQDTTRNPLLDNNGLGFISEEKDETPNEPGYWPPLLEEIIHIDIRAKVVEPSSLLLLLGSLPLILLRRKII